MTWSVMQLGCDQSVTKYVNIDSSTSQRRSPAVAEMADHTTFFMELKGVLGLSQTGTLHYITLKICSAHLTKMSSRSLHRPIKVDNNE